MVNILKHFCRVENPEGLRCSEGSQACESTLTKVWKYEICRNTFLFLKSRIDFNGTLFTKTRPPPRGNLCCTTSSSLDRCYRPVVFTADRPRPVIANSQIMSLMI